MKTRDARLQHVAPDFVPPDFVPPGFVRVVDATALREGRPLCVELEGHRLALFRAGDEYYASDDTCPHASAALSQGDQAGPRVVCSLHGWEFDLQTGACTNVAGAELRTYPCRRIGPAVYVCLDESLDETP